MLHSRSLSLSFVPAALATALAAQQPAGGAPTAPESKPAIDWKDLTRSGIPIQFYGFFRLDAYYDTARMNSVVLPFTVTAENGTAAKANDDQFLLDPRLTRFGVDVTPAPIDGTKVAGKLEIDFANFPTGSAESRATPRIRLAYVDVAGDEFGFRAGQDWDVISPLLPAVDGETLLWNAGNLGDRRAQIQGRYAPKDSGFEWKAALGTSGAITNEDLDTPAGERDGFDSGMPQLQVRASKKGDLLVDKKPAEAGIWGAIGRTETDTRFAGENRFDLWVVGLDLQLPLCQSMTLRGEAWTGANLGDWRGGIGQSINRTTGKEIGASGGWAELVYAASAKTRYHIGASTDDPDNADVPASSPRRNLVGYVGTVMDSACGLRTGFDVLYWETDWQGLGVGNTVRLNLYFQFNF